MKFTLYHGRLKEGSGPTTVDGEEIDDWGFEGPVLDGVKAVDYTYGNYTFVFKNQRYYAAAQRKTNWSNSVQEHSLLMETGEQGDLIRIYNTERERYEYFGDFMLGEL